MRIPNWKLRAYTNVDKKFCFSSVIVKAENRKAAIEKVIHFSDEKRRETGWSAGAGHVITATPYPLN